MPRLITVTQTCVCLMCVFAVERHLLKSRMISEVTLAATVRLP